MRGERESKERERGRKRGEEREEREERGERREGWRRDRRKRGRYSKITENPDLTYTVISMLKSSTTCVSPVTEVLRKCYDHKTSCVLLPILINIIGKNVAQVKKSSS